jgi:UPF0755 protein
VLAVVVIAGAGVRTVLGRKAGSSEGRPGAGSSQWEWQQPESLTRLLLGLYLWLYQAELAKPVDPDDTREIGFSIAPGETAATIGPRLEKAGLIRNARLFSALVRYRGVDHALEAGSYRLSPSMTMEEIVMDLHHGRARTVTVTIPEGWRMEQVAAKLADAGLGEADEFLALMGTSDYPYPWLHDRRDGAPESLEGFLFPDTYSVPFDASPAAVIDMMLRNFERRVTPELRRDLARQGLSFYEAVVLASIVEREAVVAEERPIIAAVFLRRLDQGMYLQADPTVSYAKGFDSERNRWWPPMLVVDSQTVQSPYNTFLYAGLPPGPICSPGLAAIEAVARPAQTSYLFFVSKGDGSHAFAETFEEHLLNVQRYRSQ